MPVMTVGQRLKEERTSVGMTQEAISALCGVSQHTWSKYEAGHWVPKFERLAAIATALDVSVDYLLGRTDERKNLAL